MLHKIKPTKSQFLAKISIADRNEKPNNKQPQSQLQTEIKTLIITQNHNCIPKSKTLKEEQN
jgi:hypothetical protein